MGLNKQRAGAVTAICALVLFALADGACYQKEEGGKVHCCDQRENGGLLHCCPGRNSSCGVEDFVNNALCFCDEFCETAGDCCGDFEGVKEVCGFRIGE